VGDVDPFEGAVEQDRGVDAVRGPGYAGPDGEQPYPPDEVGDGRPGDGEVYDGDDGHLGDEAFDDEPYEVPEPPVTGDAMVDDATRRVALAARESLDIQVAVYDAVHRGLQDRLADVED
jgi:hypothetical protein